VSFLTQHRKEEELVGLVYSLTERSSEGHLPWYKRPEALAVLVLVLALILNMIFW
jgi:SSS family solute:Na+ symporter